MFGLPGVVMKLIFGIVGALFGVLFSPFVLMFMIVGHRQIAGAATPVHHRVTNPVNLVAHAASPDSPHSPDGRRVFRAGLRAAGERYWNRYAFIVAIYICLALGAGVTLWCARALVSAF